MSAENNYKNEIEPDLRGENLGEPPRTPPENAGITPGRDETNGTEKDLKTQPETQKAAGETIVTLYEWLDTFCLALALMVTLFLFAFKYVTVDGSSMTHTLENGQKLIITGLTEYNPGDIVVICKPGEEKPLVKRIIAVGGQTVEIDFDNWIVYVDGVALDEPYVRRSAGENMKSYGFSGHITVPEGTVFVMGDNRNGSKDSRALGCIDKRNILGEVIYRLFPLGAFGKIQ